MKGWVDTLLLFTKESEDKSNDKNLCYLLESLKQVEWQKPHVI
jgi:hypothetical protein